MKRCSNSTEMYAKANGDKYNGDGRRGGGIFLPWMFGLYDSMPAMTNRLTDRISMATKTAISAHMPSLVPAPEGLYPEYDKRSTAISPIAPNIHNPYRRKYPEPLVNALRGLLRCQAHKYNQGMRNSIEYTAPAIA